MKYKVVCKIISDIITENTTESVEPFHGSHI